MKITQLSDQSDKVVSWNSSYYEYQGNKFYYRAHYPENQDQNQFGKDDFLNWF